MAKDIRLVMRAKNNLILKAIENAGYSTVAEFCKASGLKDQVVGKYINMLASPIHKNGGWTPTPLKMAEALSVDVNDLFSEWHLSNVNVVTGVEVEIDSSEYVSLGQPSEALLVEGPEADVAATDVRDLVISAISSLPPRSQIVMAMKYGLDGEPRTLEEIGQEIGVSHERAGQIVEKSLRYIRHRFAGKIDSIRGYGDFAKETEEKELAEMYRYCGTLTRWGTHG